MTSISIVMSVYNGEKYIKPQLDSLRTQTLQPDEVLIFDDRSKDNTYRIVQEYITLHDLHNWKIQENRENMGWRASFIHGIQQAKGDIVFTSDQDDIWLPNKIEIMARAFEQEHKMNVLVADYVEFSYNDIPQLTDEILNPVVEKVELTNKWYYIQRPGCVFAFRATIIPIISATWNHDYAHDALIWHVGILLDSLYHIKFTAILFRRHGTNASPLNIHNRRTRLLHIHWALNETDRLSAAINQLSAFQNNGVARKYVVLYHAFSVNRLKLVEDRNLLKIPWLFLHTKYYPSFRSLPVDIVCALMRH